MDTSDIRICFIGDSMVNGTADPTFLGWPGRVCQDAQQKDLFITHYNLGIRRDTTADIANRWEKECADRLPESVDGRVVFSFGVNDTTIEDDTRDRQRLDTETSLRLAKEILLRAKEIYTVLWVGPPPIADDDQNKRVAKLCHAFQILAAEIDIPYLPVYNTLAQSSVWMTEAAAIDGAHPQAGGYAELANLINNWSAWWF